ncbi:hypothetical protein KI387_039363, partial [Taxus chinensis]
MERKMQGASLLLFLCLFLCSWSCTVEMVNGQRQEQQQERQHQLQQRSCRVHSLRAQQPSETIRSEPCIFELSTRQENDELDCAGVDFIRKTIERDGLSLPRYANTPKLAYIIEGFDPNILAEAWGVRKETVKDIQENNQRRGLIVRVNEPRRRPAVAADFELEANEIDSSNANGVEQLFCNMRLRHNADRPEEVDVYVRDGGRLKTVNRFKLHALNHLNMAAERGILRPGAMCNSVHNQRRRPNSGGGKQRKKGVRRKHKRRPDNCNSSVLRSGEESRRLGLRLGYLHHKPQVS